NLNRWGFGTSYPHPLPLPTRGRGILKRLACLGRLKWTGVNSRHWKPGSVPPSERARPQSLPSPLWGGVWGGGNPRPASRSSRGSFHIPQIGAADFRIVADVVDAARRNDAPVDQHRDAVGESEHGVHVVLDQQDRRFLPQAVEEAGQ